MTITGRINRVKYELIRGDNSVGLNVGTDHRCFDARVNETHLVALIIQDAVGTLTAAQFAKLESRIDPIWI